MAQEMICGGCGRRETVEGGESAATCPACGGTLLWAAPDGPTVTWMPLTEELPAFDATAPDVGNEPSLPSLIPSVGPEEDTAILADGRADLEPGHRTTVVDVDPVSPTPPPPTNGTHWKSVRAPGSSCGYREGTFRKAFSRGAAETRRGLPVFSAPPRLRVNGIVERLDAGG